MALLSIRNSCLAIVGSFAFATAACASGKDDNAGPTNGEGGSENGTGGKTGDDDDDSGTGGTAEAVRLYTFTDDTQVYLYQPGNATATNDLTTASTFSWDSQDGAPDKVADAGSMRIEAPFSEYTQPDQAVDFQFMLDGRPVDLTGKTLFLYLKVDSGFSPDPSAPGGLMFYAKSHETNWDWGQAPWMNIDSANHNWRKYTFKLADAESGETNKAPFDPSQVMSIGIKLDTGSPSDPTAVDPPAPATFHLDTIGYMDDAATP
ncbi:MAG: hypothetical protein JW940_12015 [Polyangiaceae bacterium]|nr:hypothetical protein [Polyangiaceae bacterium]